KLDGSESVTVRVGNKGEDTIKNIENITGGSKGDKLGGDGKANTFDGGLGKDLLTGASGKDKFVFSTALAKSNVDTVTDFKHGQDKIVLDDAIFAAIGGKLDKAEFYAKANAKVAHDADDRVIYDAKSGKLYYDADGAGAAAAMLFATIGNHAAVTHGDFAIV
ncbi:MAG: M10 family metallopeptidase C-terminal domain-containing protein, partial [Devosia sp.]